MNRHLAAGLVLCGCFALVAGAVRQPEQGRGAPRADDEALVKNVEAYAERQAVAIDIALARQRAGKLTGIDLLVVERADLESRILLAQITEENKVAGALLTELVERDTVYMDLVTADARRLGKMTIQLHLKLSKQLAESSFRLWEHRREFGQSK